MGRIDRKSGKISRRPPLFCWLLFCLIFFCLELTARAEESSAGRKERLSAEIKLVSAGQTEVSAWIEAPDGPEDKDSEDEEAGDENSGNEDYAAKEADEKNSDRKNSKVRTGDRNSVFVPVVLSLLGAVLIIGDRLRRMNKKERML